MKTLCPKSGTRRSLRHGEEGMAVIVVVGLLAILLIYLGASARTLHQLGREVKLIEKRQQQRLALTSKTNSVILTNVAWNAALSATGH